MHARHDLYAPFHKALRAFMADTLRRVGALDVDDPPAAAADLDAVTALLDLLAHHQQIEDRFVMPAVEPVAPGTIATAATDHRALAGSHEALATLTAEVAVAIDERRASRTPLAARLYRHLTAFVVEQLTHMADEEATLAPLLWLHYTDDELGAISATIMAWEPPAKMTAMLRWLVPALTPQERARLFSGGKLLLPPPVYDQLLGFVRGLMPPSDFAKLEAALA